MIKNGEEKNRPDAGSLQGSSAVCLSAADNIKSKTVKSLEFKTVV